MIHNEECWCKDRQCWPFKQWYSWGLLKGHMLLAPSLKLVPQFWHTYYGLLFIGSCNVYSHDIIYIHHVLCVVKAWKRSTHMWSSSHMANALFMTKWYHRFTWPTALSSSIQVLWACSTTWLAIAKASFTNPTMSTSTSTWHWFVIFSMGMSVVRLR